ncbi:MAG: 16S rRNA (adenine(1518)-N(6)/adenine(1519)-N(6))-dimethyltransferase RsmA [Aigarchaeota archaeon]|nr:16S rRNA (adenine(1518)-N(6)/adenine(1519)-N(6))-dimethyltransferase RsmA [Aigarchaeota archaeon]MCX8192574.1 16S rRNA (adenine(1518)-N(6)/adenine(1519)-N(6))-dimethyltransferase RsmA [Nitrososphaeria archaeon]MDW7985690.1 16S rRNA (adenine(1518)-N(6)/adenine(1519)-N(6))-dimethyltransferase RsmA [Nitrososphaerota archaeon]
MRKLGQHFLVDNSILDRIVEYGEISESDVVLEVGAGTGELTWRLAERAKKVIAVEIDEKLALEASHKLAKYSNVELIIEDILKLNLSEFNKVVSNPPYNISTKLLHWLIMRRPKKIVLTLQKEFAQKLISKPCTKNYVYTSFLANLFYTSEILEEIPRNAFKPMPKVNSVILSMKRREDSISCREEELKFIKILFTQKMKKLKTVLRSVSRKIGIDLKEIEGYISDEVLSKRVYCLTPEELHNIVNILLKY